MFLFILESIGTSELILIAVVALIVLGPRKLPQMAKTIGKTMSEFRNATSEFKTTWEKEVAFEDENITVANTGAQRKNPIMIENSIAGNAVQTPPENSLSAPQVRQLSPADIARNFQNRNVVGQQNQAEEIYVEKATPDKRDWL
jgi:Tat protein translocase TatB subunit